MKNKKIIILILLIPVSLLVINSYSLKNIKKEYIDVNKYIEIVDEVSENKVQINWKYVVAIIGVKEKNKLKNISDEEIRAVSNLFLESSDEAYKLNSLEIVLEKLDFNNNEKKRVSSYIENLKYFGLTPNRLVENTKYTKFIEEIKVQAIKNYKEYKVLPSITIAQAILESGWGESTLAKEHNNLFGIKADIYWTGEAITLETTEYQGEIINDKFRKYKEKSESLKDHAKFLAENKRYKQNNVFEANTYKYQAKSLEDAGYSTAIDENGTKIYANKLINLIRQYNLQLIDSEVQS